MVRDQTHSTRPRWVGVEHSYVCTGHTVYCKMFYISYMAIKFVLYLMPSCKGVRQKTDNGRQTTFTDVVESTTSVVGDFKMSSERISDAELTIMEILWERAPLTATDVAARLPDDRDWSLPTVKTLLSRLLTKAAVEHRADGRRFLYSPLIDREDYVSHESKRLVDRLFGGRLMPLVAHLAEQEKLSDADISEIERLLREMKS